MIKRIFPVAYSILLLISAIPLDCLGGSLVTQGIYYPNNSDIFELRTTVIAEETIDLARWLTIDAECKLTGLLSNREDAPGTGNIIIDKAYIHIHFSYFDARFGYLKETWGKLDQISPVDILNPIDIASVFFESEKTKVKLPILMSMVSIYFSDSFTLELSVIPFFEKSVYDEMDEESSPFNVASLPLPVEEQLPAKTIGNIEFGTGLYFTLNKTDCSLYYFHGFQDFPSYLVEGSLPPTKIFAQYPPIQMIGLDFETVIDRWGIRGECSFIIGEGYQRKETIDYVEANSITSGIGIDTRYGDSYFDTSLLYRKIFAEENIEEKKDEISITANVEKRIAYDTVEVDLIGIYNIFSGSIHGKARLGVSPFDNFWISLAIGVFDSESGDFIGRLRNNEFYYIKFAYSF